MALKSNMDTEPLWSAMDSKKFPKFIPSLSFSPTARGGWGEVVRGLEAGAGDYNRKPHDLGELRARVQVGVRLVELQHTLANRVRELGEALARVKQPNGLLPICRYCKKNPGRPELLAAGRGLYQQAFGSPIQPRHLSRLLEKIIGPELEKLPPDAKRHDEDP